MYTGTEGTQKPFPNYPHGIEVTGPMGPKGTHGNGMWNPWISGLLPTSFYLPPGEGHGIQTVVAIHSVSDEWIQHILTVEVK